MIKTNDSLGETPESSQSFGKFLGIGLVILALFGFLSEEKTNKISIAGIKKRRSNKLFYMFATDQGLKTIPKDRLDYLKLEWPNKVYAVWALNADRAREKIAEGHGENYLDYEKLSFSGHLLNCIGWQQVIDKKGNNITRCFIMAPNCKTKACVKETEERRAEGWKPKGRKALQGVNLSCKQYIRDAYNKLRCKKYALTCASENECATQKAPIPWKPVDVEYTPKAIKSVAKVLAEEMNQSIDDTKRVMRSIKSHGGIAPYAGGYLQEEYRDIPSKYKSKEGIKLDELAQEMEMNESELVEAIGKAEEARSRLPRGKRRFTVKDLMFDAGNYLRKQESGLQGLGKYKSGDEGETIKEAFRVLKKHPQLKNVYITPTAYHGLVVGDDKPPYGTPYIEVFESGKVDTYLYVPRKGMVLQTEEKKIAEKGGQMTLFGKFKELTNREIILNQIDRLERENKKLTNILLLPKPYQDIVEGRFSKQLDKAMSNSDKIIELKEKLKTTEKIANEGVQMTLFGKMVARKIAMRA